jgi:acyl-CoA synthetase (AMP-forming)/AMP-acid ligase II
MSSLHAPPDPAVDPIIRSPWPAPPIPETDLTSFVLRHAARLADTRALIDGASGRSLTYGARAAGVERAAAGLARRGFGRGDVLALHLPNLPEFPLALHAGLRAGGVVTPASPLFTVGELADQLRRARARVLVTAAGPLAEVATAAAAEAGVEDVLVLGEAPGLTPFAELMGGDGEPPVERPAPGDAAVMLPSSGTTGLPKLVQLSHRALVANACQTAIAYPIEEDDRVLGLAPFFHSMGLSCVLHLALASGATVVSIARFDLEVMLGAMAAHRVTTALVAPPLLTALARLPLVASFDLSALRMLGSGGAAAGAALERAAAERLGCVVAQGYGITEAGPLVAVGPVTEPERIVPGSPGRLVPGTEAKVVDTVTGESLPRGADGEIWVRGPQLMDGYRDDPAATAASLDAGGWLHTGDLGHFDEDGNIFLVDRLKELIKVRGFQVAPAELEAVLTSHPAVADAAVVGVPDEADGERPRAYVVTRGELDADSLRAYVAERVAPYKRLAEIEVVDQVPRSMTGKLLRRVLADRVRAASTAA